MFVYLATFCGLLATTMLGKANTSRLAFLLWWLFLFLFVGTRVDTGCDYVGYQLRYSRYYAYYPFEDLLADSERGFSLLCMVLQSLGLSFHWVVLTCAAIFFVCLLRFCWRFEERVLMLALFLPVVITQLVMSGMRQATALAFLLLALKAFSEKRRLSVIGWTVVASQFHASACVFLPLAFLISKREIRLRTLVIALAVAVPLALFLLGDRADLYQARYLNRASGEMTSKGAALRLGLLFFSSAMFWRRRKGYQECFPDAFPLMQLFALVPLILVPMFAINSVAVHRLIYYVAPVHVLILALQPALSKSVAERQQRRFASLAVYGAYQVAWFSFSRHAAAGYVPYQSFLL